MAVSKEYFRQAEITKNDDLQAEERRRQKTGNETGKVSWSGFGRRRCNGWSTVWTFLFMFDPSVIVVEDAIPLEGLE